MSDQQALFDPTLAAEEQAIFGDDLKPTRANFVTEGDWLFGYCVDIQRSVDLKTGFDPVDIMIVEGITGLLNGHTQRVRPGVLYAVALLHTSLRNRVDEYDPDPSKRERIGLRRDRDFVSNLDGPTKGKTVVGWLVNMPDRPKPDPEPVKGKAAAKRTRRTTKATEPDAPPVPTEEPF